jgi:hypothetical protein
MGARACGLGRVERGGRGSSSSFPKAPTTISYIYSHTTCWGRAVVPLRGLNNQICSNICPTNVIDQLHAFGLLWEVLLAPLDHQKYNFSLPRCSKNNLSVFLHDFGIIVSIVGLQIAHKWRTTAIKHMRRF